MSDPAATRITLLRRGAMRILGLIILVAAILFGAYSLALVIFNDELRRVAAKFLLTIPFALMYGAGFYLRRRWPALLCSIFSTILSITLLAGIRDSYLPMASLLLALFFLLPLLLLILCWRDLA